MSRNERYFLNGIIRHFKPKKILEVGVANGGGSSLILNAISDIDGAKLYSVDYTKKSYKHPEKPSGFLVEEKFPHLMDKWEIFRGGDISCFIETIGGDIDLLVLDTVHSHPWETLNFLCVLPFMKRDSWTVLHDISILHSGALACRYLFGHVVSEEKICPVSEHEYLPANIGAFKVSDITFKHINDLFGSLMIQWEAEVKPEDLETISAVIKKYYPPEQYSFFCDVINVQKRLAENSRMKLYPALKMFLNRWQPGMFKRLQAVRRMFRPKLR